MKLHALDVLIIGAFVAWAVANGLRARRRASSDLEQYFLAGRSLSGWQAGLSMAATQFAADTPLLVTGLVATAGIFALWQMWVYALAFLLMGFVLAPSWRRAGVLTDAELTELRYASRAAPILRAVKAVYFGTVFNCVVLAWVLFATRTIAEPFLVWHAWLPSGLFEPVLGLVQLVGVPLATDPAGPDVWIHTADNLLSVTGIVTVTLFYSATGGLRSVVSTDLVQLAIALGGTAIYAGCVVAHFGGMEALIDALRTRFAAGGPGGISPDQILAFTPSQARDASWAVLAVFSLQWFIQLNADGTGYLAQRSMACRSDHDARLAGVVFSFAQIVLRSLLWLPIALGLLVLFPPDGTLAPELVRADREATFVRGMAELLPVGVRGLMLAAMLGALASTIDTHLNWGASYWTRDLYERFYCRSLRGIEPDPRALVWVARLSSVGLLAVALGVMTQLTSIERTWRVALLLGAGMGPMLVLRWLWWRVSAWGELACIGVSAGVALPLIAAPLGEAVRLLAMAALSTAAGVAVSLATPESRDALRGFYERARPPGFWGEIAIAAGDDPHEPRRRLSRGVAAVLATALVCFALLTGLGSWLVMAPPPEAWPWGRTSWVVALLATAGLCAPFAWRWGFTVDGEAETDRAGVSRAGG